MEFENWGNRTEGLDFLIDTNSEENKLIANSKFV